MVGSKGSILGKPLIRSSTQMTKMTAKAVECIFLFIVVERAMQG